MSQMMHHYVFPTADELVDPKISPGFALWVSNYDADSEAGSPTAADGTVELAW